MIRDPRRGSPLFAISIGPLVEEIFFRGSAAAVGGASLGPIAGILIGAVPFALLHGPQYAWSWRHRADDRGAGSAFGWWRAADRFDRRILADACGLQRRVRCRIFSGKDSSVIHG